MSDAVWGDKIAEGKTKIIYKLGFKPAPESDLVVLYAKDDITAGDGKKHDVMPGKGEWANQTTCNVFRLLKACGLPVAFDQQVHSRGFRAPRCTMLLYEVVVRREGHGSYLERNPLLRKGHHFPKLVVEFFLKTTGKKWHDHQLVADDPYMIHAKGACNVELYDPHKPIQGQRPFLTLPETQVFSYDEEWKLFPEMAKIAQRAFLILEKAWQLEGRKLVDFKVEFGLDPKGRMLLADVIDNDSWRVVEDEGYIDKQVYRDGGGLDEVAAKYRHVAELTSHFHLPHQRILFWRGTSSDNLEPFTDALRSINRLEVVWSAPITCSVHKEPIRAIRELRRHLQEVPDSVIIVYVGLSNGAGPTLSAASTCPVITVPATCKDFPDDVWSSLRMPSDVPVMTVLRPENAVLAAANILSARNPYLYAELRQKLEERLSSDILQ